MIPFIKSLALVGGAIGPTIAPIVQPSMANNQSEYETLMQPENFHYSAFDWENEHGYRLGFSLGYALVENFYDEEFDLTFYNYGVYGTGADLSVLGLGWSGSDSGDYIASIFDFNNLVMYIDEVITNERDDYYCCFYMTTFGQGEVMAVIYDVYNAEWSYFHYDDAWIITGDMDLGYDTCEIYFDDGRHLPQGVSFDDNLKSYFVPNLKSADDSLLDIMAGFIDETIVSDKTGFLDSMEFTIGGQVVSMRKWLVWSIAIVGLLVLVVALFFFIRWIFRLTAGLFGGR